MDLSDEVKEILENPKTMANLTLAMTGITAKNPILMDKTFWLTMNTIQALDERMVEPPTAFSTLIFSGMAIAAILILKGSLDITLIESIQNDDKI